MEQIRVLIADDHPLFRDGLRTLLQSEFEAEVAGEAATGEETISMAATLQPDVILMDIHMPGINGIEATRRILHTSPHISILIVTMYEEDDSVFAAMRAGARWYLLKGADQDETLRALQAVSHGEAIFSPAIAKRLIRYFTPTKALTPPQAFPELTEREREILALLAPGTQQCRDCAASGAQPQNRAQSPLQYLQQAPGRCSRPGNHSRTGGWTRMNTHAGSSSQTTIQISPESVPISALMVRGSGGLCGIVSPMWEPGKCPTKWNCPRDTQRGASKRVAKEKKDLS